MEDDELIAPQKPESYGLLSNTEILFGSPIPAIDRLKILSATEFENMIREWMVEYCQSIYIKVWRAGGALDKGRDVIGYVDENTWDNYQSKHYDHPLMPSDIWLELGKFCYYTFIKTYTIPRKYYFVSPQGVGPSLGDLLSKPDELKAGLLEQWDTKCKDSITSKEEIALSEDLRRHIVSLDFSVFSFIDPQNLIEQHKQTSYYATRFGGGLVRRQKPIIQKEIKAEEMVMRYIEQLFAAYESHLNTNVKDINELSAYEELFEHFNRQRQNFYWAEALKEFSRDNLPGGNTCFEDLMEEIYQGVVDLCNSTAGSGYDRVVQTTTHASRLAITSNALLSVSYSQDKIGICHHLANVNRLIWVRK